MSTNEPDYPDGIEKIPDTKLNCYILRQEDHTILIDTGVQYEYNKIQDYLDGHEIKPEYVLITAVDYIHVGALNEIYDKYKPEIYVPKREMDKMKHGLKMEGILEIEGKGLQFNAVRDIHSYKAFDLNFLEIIDTPGYTVNSVSIYSKEKNSIFIGDAAYSKKNKLKIDQMFVSNIKEANNSLEKIKSYAPVYVFPSHGGAVYIE